MKTTKTLLVILLLASLNCYAHDFKITHYSPSNGLPYQYVFDVVQDSSGVLIVTTNNGVFTYDGYDFESISIDHERFSHFNLFTKDNKGGVYAIRGELRFAIQKFINGQFKEILNVDKNLFFDDNYYENHPIDFKVINNGEKFYVLTTSSLFIYNKDHWKKIEIFKPNGEDQLFGIEILATKVLLSSSRGICEVFKTDSLRFWSFPALPGIQVMCTLYENELDRLWILGTDWLGFFQEEKFTSIVNFDAFPKFHPNYDERITLFKYYEHLFFGSRLGAYYYNYDSNLLSKLDQEFGLLAEGIHSIYRDYENNLWIASPRGLDKLLEVQIKNLNKNDGLLENEVSSIAKLNNEVLLIGHNYGFSIIDSHKVIPLELKDNFGSKHKFSRVIDMETKKNGNVIFASSANGIGYIDSDYKINWFNTKLDVEFISIFNDEDKGLYIGTNHRLYYYFNDSTFLEHRATVNKELYVRKIFEISHDTIAICSYNGLYIIQGDSTIKKLSPHNHSPNFYTGLKTKKGEILLGTAQGILKFSDNKFYSHPFNENINSSAVYFIHEIDNKLFIGTNNGLYINEGERWVNYNYQNGLSGDETNRDAFFYEDGYIWVGTNNGLSKAKVSSLLADYKPPKIQLKGLIDKNGEEYNLTDNITLPFDHNFFKIHFRALSFIDESSNEFRIRVINLDEMNYDEVITTDPFLQLFNQSPGQYRFEIAARNIQSDWSPPLKSGVITIKQPYYFSFWFVSFIAITFIFIAFSINKFYLKSKYAEKLEIEVDNKTFQIKDYSDKFKLISKNITDIFWIVDKDLRVTFISDSFERIFGEEGSAFVGDNLVVNELLNKVKISLSELSRKGTIKREAIQKNKNGNKIWTEIIIDPIITNNEFNGFVAVTRDITARKNIDRIKAEAITETSEIERNRIARELHDHIGQILASIKLRLELFSQKTEDSNVLKAKEQVLMLGEEVQKIILDMNPIDRAEKNLDQYLCELYEKTKANFNLDIFFEHEFDSRRIPSEKSLILYRIIQESLTNVVRHSNSSIAKVKLRIRKDFMIVSVTDNGHGFDTSNNKLPRKRFGLVSIKQRAKLLNGEVKILSKRGWGSSIQLRIPIEELKNA